MSVLFFWRGDYYVKDMREEGKDYCLNSDNDLMLNLKAGERVWAFTRREDKTYVLAADLVVARTKVNQPGDDGYRYGKYKAVGDRQRSRYFDVERGPDAEPTIRGLSPPSNAVILGHSFQGRNAVRPVTLRDEQQLTIFSSGLPTIDC